MSDMCKLIYIYIYILVLCNYTTPPNPPNLDASRTQTHHCIPTITLYTTMQLHAFGYNYISTNTIPYYHATSSCCQPVHCTEWHGMTLHQVAPNNVAYAFKTACLTTPQYIALPQIALHRLPHPTVHPTALDFK